VPVIARVLVMAVSVLLAAGAGSAEVPRSRAEIALSFAPVVSRAAPAVVTVYTRKLVAERRLPFAGDPFFERFFGEMFPDARARRRVRTSLGSGVIVDPDGLVISNHHVVAGADEITVRLADRREFDGRVILADESADLAVVRLEGARDLPALALARDAAPAVGDLVLAIGNPFGVGQTVTSGIVSGLARAVPGRNGGRFIQTDAAINPGNSGGALVDMAGRLVGVPTSILSRSGGSNGIGFAVPADLVARVVAAAREGRSRLPRPWLGVAGQAVDGDLAAALGFDRPRGVLVSEVHPQGPLARAGIEPGDVLLSLGDAPLQTPGDLDHRAATLGPGAQVRLAYLREGKRRVARIRLDLAPEQPPRDRLRLARGALAGLVVERVNPAVIAERGLPLSARGLVVVALEGPARRAGLEPGDLILAVDGRAAGAPRDLARALGDGRPSVLEVERAGRRGRVRVPG